MLTVKKSDAIRRFQKQKLLKIIWIIFLFFWGDRTTSTQETKLRLQLIILWEFKNFSIGKNLIPSTSILQDERKENCYTFLKTLVH